MKSVYVKPAVFSEKTFETSALACAKTATTSPAPVTHWGPTNTFTGHFGAYWGGTSTYTAPLSGWSSITATSFTAQYACQAIILLSS
jgi:hypothetical protein